MRFEKNIEERYTTLKVLEEKLDSTNAPKLKSELIMLNTEGVKNLILDLSPIRYADSSGLSCLVVANRLCADVEGVLVLVNLSEYVQKLITISQLDRVLNIFPTEQEAIEAIKEAELAGELGVNEDAETVE